MWKIFSCGNVFSLYLVSILCSNIYNFYNYYAVYLANQSMRIATKDANGQDRQTDFEVIVK